MFRESSSFSSGKMLQIVNVFSLVSKLDRVKIVLGA